MSDQIMRLSSVPGSDWMPYARGQVGVESSGNRRCPLGNLRTATSLSYIYQYFEKTVAL